jgi:cysteine desulfurase
MQLFSRRVYADAAAATPLSPRAKKELIRLVDMAGNAGGLHREALAAHKELETARARSAQALGAHSDEIFFTSGGTEGNNMALGGAVSALAEKFGRIHAITLSIEHPSVLEPLRAMALEGHIELTELPVEADGRLSIDALKEAIRPHTALISIQTINSEIGTIQDIREIAKTIRHARRQREISHIAPSDSKARGQLLVHDLPLPLLFHTDASQAPLWLPLNVEKLGIDLMTLDGQKIMGPKGVGLLFVKRGTPLQPVVFGGGQERGLRSGTENVPLIGSFSVALEEAQAGVEERAARVSNVRDFLMSELRREVPASSIYGALGEWRAANNCSLRVPGLLGDMAVLALDVEGVAASTRSACSSDEEAPSHVIRALGFAPNEAREVVRITLLPSATRQDAKHIVSALKSVVQRHARVIE